MQRIEERTYAFSLSVVRFVLQLPKGSVTEVLGKQLLRSGTSIGANVEEAIGATTKRDFTYRMSIALREARETYYWFRIIKDSKVTAHEGLSSLLQESREIALILSKTVSTSKARISANMKDD